MSPLVVTIPDENRFYSLFADGLFTRKVYVKGSNTTLITYDENVIVVLYYTYPTHREACVIRNTAAGTTFLPGLSKKVTVLFSVYASQVDKLRRAVAFLNRNSGGAYSRNDGFYIRLSFLASRRGRINYAALGKLAETHIPRGQSGGF